MISVRFQHKPFNITMMQVYAPNTDAEEAEIDQYFLEVEVAHVKCVHVHKQAN